MIIWYKDENHRVYIDAAGVKHSGPIEREKWRPLEVVEESSRSWKLSNGNRVLKKIVFPTWCYALTEQQVDDMVWQDDHAHRIADKIHSLDVATLRKIAEIIGYTG